jgi:hypothetical protein
LTERFANPWTYGNPSEDQASAERIERIRNGVLLECEYQFTGKASAEMASPVYEALSRHIADSPHHLKAMAHARQANIRLILSAVHHLVLLGDPHPLREWFPTVGGTRKPDDDLIETFEDFIAARAPAVEERLRTKGVQTNEVRRCAALWAAFTEALEVADGPLALIELGCSSGLNLVFDRYGYRYSDGRTAGDTSSSLTIECRIDGDGSPPLADEIPVSFRIGIDHDPVDLSDAEQISWMRACIWPDHGERLRMFDAAVEIARSDPPNVIQGDMVDTVASAVDMAPDNSTVCVFSTSAIAYLRRARREELADLLSELSKKRPILWVTGEGPSIVPGAPAPMEALERVAVPMILTQLRNDQADHRLLGLTGAHGGWLEWLSD